MDAAAELARRMARPQRHRLLHGYPMAPLLRLAADGEQVRGADGSLDGASPWLDLDATRPLIVGVMPHAMCIPTVSGCGFCTFPQSAWDGRAAVAQQRIALTDIATAPEELHGRTVAAVYFGGATANLTRPERIEGLMEALKERYDVADAEVTLEGIPSAFVTRLSDRLARFASLPVRHRRISMGIQTFDDVWLERMGRARFGDAKTFARVVKRAHKRGLTTSCDLLFNLPGQPVEAMVDDVRRAVAAGFDQLCLYNLVLYEGLGTLWSKDAQRVAAMPSNERACEAWLAVRAAALEAGYVQTTLTNFERRDVQQSDRRFVYEEFSFTPERYDAIGVGLHGISTFVDLDKRRAAKLVRGVPRRLDSWEYAKPWSGNDSWFPYDEQDLQLLFVTRALPRMRLSRATFQQVFGTDVLDVFGPALSAAADAGLLKIDEDEVAFTERGMFYADAVAGTAAAPRAAEVRDAATGKRTLAVLQERSFYGGMG